MKRQPRSRWKIIAFDTLAVFCFAGVIVFGWLPGPGGVPLFILGLSLLAANHEWAERWLDTAKHKGVSIKQWLFPDIAWVRWLYDLLAIVMIAGGFYLLSQAKHRWQEGLLVLVVCIGLFLFLLNRERLDKLGRPFRRRKP